MGAQNPKICHSRLKKNLRKCAPLHIRLNRPCYQLPYNAHLTIFRLPGVPGGVFPDFREEQRRYFALLVSSISGVAGSFPVSQIKSFCCTEEANELFSDDSDTNRE